MQRNESRFKAGRNPFVNQVFVVRHETMKMKKQFLSRNPFVNQVFVVKDQRLAGKIAAARGVAIPS